MTRLYSFQEVLIREQRTFAPTRNAICEEVGRRHYKGWTFVVWIKFVCVWMFRHTLFRKRAEQVVGRDREFLMIIQTNKKQIQTLWRKYESFFSVGEDSNYATGCLDSGIGRRETETFQKVNTLVSHVKFELAQAGWKYPLIEAKIGCCPGWVTTKACINVWDDVENFLLSRILALEM